MNKMLSFFVVVVFCLAGVFANEGEIAYYKTPQQVHLAYTNDPTTLAVSWYTKSPQDLLGGVWYGIDQQSLGSFSSSKSMSLSDGTGFYHTAVMTELEPGRIYHYFVGSRHEFFSDIYTFRIPNPSEKVRIIAFGDMGTFPRGDTTLMHSLRVHEVNPTEPQRMPSVVLQAGDLMYPFGNDGMIAAWFDAMQKVGARVPFMVAPGNRDQQDIITERFDMPMSAYGAHPEPARHNFYYSFDVNFVHFVVISTNFDNFHSGSPQYNWLKNDIEKAQKEVQDPKSSISWIVLMGHTPIYSSSDGHTQGNQELKLAIEALIEPVTVCLWGDDHVYERSHPIFQSHPDVLSNIHVMDERPSKPIHITVGTGGIDNDGWAVDQPEWSAERFITKGYLSMEAKKNSFSVAFIDRDSREVRDYFDIRENGGLNAHPLLLAGGFLLFVGFVAMFLKGKKGGKSGPGV